jgi:integrase
MAKTFTQAAVAKAKPIPGKTRIIKDAGSRGMFLVVQSSGHKSFAMRWRRAGGGEDKIVLGPVDLTGRCHDAEPVIGQPLGLVQARHLAAKLNANRAAGIDVVARHRAAKQRQGIAINEAASNSFSAAVGDFVAQHAKPKTRGWKETASLLGVTDELEMKKNGLADRWSDHDIRSIDGHNLFNVVEEARRFGIPGTPTKRDGPSESRARKMHAALSQMFSWLQQRRRIEVNPMASLHPPTVPASRDRVLSTNEIVKLWAAIDASQPGTQFAEPYAAVIKLLLITGCRLNEIARLEWSEVSEDCTTLTIPGSRTKNHLVFIVPLPPLARSLFPTKIMIDEKYVFSTSGGIAPVSIGSKIKGRLDAAMGDVLPWRLHDIRRTVATGMAAIGVPPHVVEAVLNHISGFRASVAGTYNRHSYLTEKKEALERWASHLEGVVSGTKKLTSIRGGRS